MADYPWFKWYSRDWISDTRGLSAAAKGVWADMLSFMDISGHRGVLREPIGNLAKKVGVDVTQLVTILKEFEIEEVCDVSRTDDGWVTVMSRRMSRDEKKREQARLRKQRERESRKRHVEDGEKKNESRKSHRENSELRAQKLEKKKKEVAIPSPEAQECASIHFQFLSDFNVTQNGKSETKWKTEAAGEYDRAIKNKWASLQDVTTVFQYVRSDQGAFWRDKLQSVKSMFVSKNGKRKFDTVLAQAKMRNSQPRQQFYDPNRGAYVIEGKDWDADTFSEKGE